MFKLLAIAATLFASIAVAAVPVSNSLSIDVHIEAPATFEYSDLIITPEVVSAGGNVTVVLRVDNTGDQAGAYILSLKVDGTEIQTSDSTLGRHRHERPRFVFVASGAGLHNVTVGGLTGSYTVEAAPVAGGINWWVLIGIIIAAAAIVLFFLMRAPKDEQEAKPSIRERFVGLLDRFKRNKPTPPVKTANRRKK